MEERRRLEDKNWEEFRAFIAESREYRAADKVTQDYIKFQVAKTNGRVDKLEDFQKEQEVRSQDKKDSSIHWQGVLSVGAASIAALAAVWAILKK